MTVTPGERDLETHEASLERLGALAKEALPTEVDPFTAARGRARVAAAFAERAEPRRFGIGWRGVMVIASTLVALLLVPTWIGGPPAPLEVTRSGQPLDPTGYVRVGASDAPAELAFSDGSQVTFHPSARGRFGAVTSKGASVVLEEGVVSLAIEKRPSSFWAVHAGPFVVEVTGTRFDVRWESHEEALEVRLYEGSLIVREPLARDGIRMRAGEKLTASPRPPRLSLDLLDDGPRPSSESTAPEEPSSPEPAASTSALESKRQRPAEVVEAPSWSDHVRQGRFGEVLRQAKQRGLSKTLAQASRAELVALADAARYEGDHPTAEAALLAQRRRFARHQDAHTAAFLLGRLAEDHRLERREALAWFRRYLEESPRGPFVAEALGRAMALEQKLGNRAAAEESARTYLARFPGGPYAPLARELLASSTTPATIP